MYFAFYCEDKPNNLALRLAVRDAHLVNLRKLVDAGRVLLAGPHPKVAGGMPAEVGFAGSLMVIDFDTQQQAQAWIDADPYVVAGVFKKITVLPFVQVFPET